MCDFIVGICKLCLTIPWGPIRPPPPPFTSPFYKFVESFKNNIPLCIPPPTHLKLISSLFNVKSAAPLASNGSVFKGLSKKGAEK